MDDPTITNSINVDDIRYEKEIINMFLTKIIPYNVSSYYPLHKFWVYVDKSVVTKNIFTNKIRTITVALTLKSDCIKEIKSIEQQINNKLEDDELITESKIESKLSDCDTFVPTFEITIDEDSKLFEENNDEIKNSRDISTKDCLELVCELDFILIGNGFMKPVWRVVHLKRFELLNLKVPIFDKIKKKHKENKKHEQTHSQQHNQPAFHQTQEAEIQHHPVATIKHTEQTKPSKNVQQAPPKIGFVIPSPKDLQNALSGLKKVKIDDSAESPVNNSQSSSQKIELKHVETKESNPIQMLKDERKMMEDYKDLTKLEELRKKEKKYRTKLHNESQMFFS